MTLLDRLRQWLFGGDGDAASGDGNDSGDESDDADEPRLDPDQVTEVRSERETDRAAALRDIRDGGEDGAREGGDDGGPNPGAADHETDESESKS